jgi:hypothetical protein
MKNLLLFLVSLLMFSSCKQTAAGDSATDSRLEYFGEPIDLDGSIASTAFFDHFTAGDSIEMKMTGEIKEVCQKKGCWMSMPIGADDEIFVRFKDYGFFVPLNADGRIATIEGWAYKEVMTVEELKHYAFDAGESDEVIAAITEPEVSYTFMAKGVVIE